MKHAWQFSFIVPLVWACTDQADERARRDEAVGHYNEAGIEIDVGGGLAVIREADTEHAMIWSSAPLWSATVRGPLNESFSLELRNIVPGSTLLATTESGDPLPVQLEDVPRPTQRRFSVTSNGQAFDLTLVPPQADAADAFQIGVLSDIQAAITRVQDLYDLLDQEDVDFVVGCGDLTDNGTLDQLQAFEAALAGLNVPFYNTLGNHELFYSSVPPYQDVFGRTSYHFDYRGVAFSFVDSASATVSSLVLDQLEEWLADARTQVHLVLSHIPPIDPIGVRGGAFASKVEARAFLALLARGRVDGAFYGHIHSYYDFVAGGVRSYISGGGGGRPERLSGIGRHYLVVRLSHDELGEVRVVEVD